MGGGGDPESVEVIEPAKMTGIENLVVIVAVRHHEPENMRQSCTAIDTEKSLSTDKREKHV